MNCKPGDLAVYVGSCRQSYGMIVRVLRPYPWPEPAWYVDPPLVKVESGGFEGAARDCALRPIRDQPGEDETLTWAGKPQEVTA